MSIANATTGCQSGTAMVNFATILAGGERCLRDPHKNEMGTGLFLLTAPIELVLGQSSSRARDRPRGPSAFTTVTLPGGSGLIKVKAKRKMRLCSQKEAS